MPAETELLFVLQGPSDSRRDCRRLGFMQRSLEIGRYEAPGTIHLDMLICFGLQKVKRHLERAVPYCSAGTPIAGA